MPKCNGCSCQTPRPHRVYCDYCSNRYTADRLMGEPVRFELAIRMLAARERMAAMDRAERPRVTRDSRELAKPHPWECDETGP
jgi:hypothetical protein